MTRKTKKYRFRHGFSLVEIMIATVILSVAVLGASGYRYYAALNARKAANQIAAARVALLLCESWRGVKGVETYDPAACFGSELPITTMVDATNEAYAYVPGGFSPLRVLKVTLNDVDYYAALSWKDIDTELRALSVIVAWGPRVSQSMGAEANYGYLWSCGTYETGKSFELTTYTQK